MYKEQVKVLECGTKWNGSCSAATHRAGPSQIRRSMTREDGLCAHPRSAHCAPLISFPPPSTPAHRAQERRLASFDAHPLLHPQATSTHGGTRLPGRGSSLPFHSPLPSTPPLLLGTEGCSASHVALEASKCSLWGQLPQAYREVELAAEGLQGSQPQEAQVRLLSLTHGTVHGHKQGFSFSFLIKVLRSSAWPTRQTVDSQPPSGLSARRAHRRQT